MRSPGPPWGAAASVPPSTIVVPTAAPAPLTLSRRSEPTTETGVVVGRGMPSTAAAVSRSAAASVVGPCAALITASAHATVVVPWPPRAPSTVMWRAGGGASPTPPPLASTDRRWRSGRIGHDPVVGRRRGTDELVVRSGEVVR